MRDLVWSFCAAAWLSACAGEAARPRPALEEVKLDTTEQAPIDAPSEPAVVIETHAVADAAAEAPKPLAEPAETGAAFLGEHQFSWSKSSKKRTKNDASPSGTYRVQVQREAAEFSATVLYEYVTKKKHQGNETMRCRGDLRGDRLTLHLIRCEDERGEACAALRGVREGEVLFELRAQSARGDEESKISLHLRNYKPLEPSPRELQADPPQPAAE